MSAGSVPDLSLFHLDDAVAAGQDRSAMRDPDPLLLIARQAGTALSHAGVEPIGQFGDKGIQARRLDHPAQAVPIFDAMILAGMR